MKAAARSKRGFTLVEIMVVVLIVGLLSTLAVAAIHRVKRKTEDVMVYNILRQLYNAKEEYLSIEGAEYTTFSKLVQRGYISSTLAASVQHDIGHWNTSSLRNNSPLKPTTSISASERFQITNAQGRASVSLGRTMKYPSN